MLTPVSAREAFHVLLLEYLIARLRPESPSAFALKGGVNLRLYFGSPRYSQDIDFDAEPRLRSALRTAIRQGLQDPDIRRAFVELGGDDVRVPADPVKDTATTLRFKFGVVLAGVDHPTKIEVSFRQRAALDVAVAEAAPSSLVDPYRVPAPILAPAPRRARGRSPVVTQEPIPPGPLVLPHYPRLPALRQKIGALAGRTEVQARDVFDLSVLGAGDVDAADAAQLRAALSTSTLREAQARTFQITYAEYRDQVLEYLDDADRAAFEGPGRWDELCLTAGALIERLLVIRTADVDAPDV